MIGDSELQRRFRYHTPGTFTQEEMEKIRAKFITLARYLDKNLPDGREKALAFTHLEETLFFVMASLARPQAL